MGGVLTSVLVESSRDAARQALPRPLVGRVVVVDDMYDDAILLAALLAPLEACVVVARSAGEALAIVDEQVVDLVVTDLNMPETSGLDLMRKLQRRLDVPAVIFITGSTLAGDKVTAFELGAAAYLKKPVDVGYLIELAREILHVRRAKRTNDATRGRR